MPPLTLEQVLARSMRLPRQRLKAGLFSQSAQMDGSAVSRKNDRNQIDTSDPASMEFLLKLEQDDEQKVAKRMSITTKNGSSHMIRNSQDLLTFLNTAKRVGAWEDAVAAFTAVTGVSFLSNSTHVENKGVDPTDPQSSSTTAAPYTISPNEAHLHILIDACAFGGKLDVVREIAVQYGPTHHSVLVHCVSRVAEMSRRGNQTAKKTGVAASGSSSLEPAQAKPSWQAALDLVELIPCHQRPIAAYNTCFSECDKAGAWEAALHILSKLGKAPTYSPPTKEKETDTATTNTSGSSSELGADNESSSVGPVEGEAPLAATSDSSTTAAAINNNNNNNNNNMPSPPQANAVTYATLIGILEKADKYELTHDLMNVMPPLEREEIMASYAALIHVWSDQVYHSKRRWK